VELPAKNTGSERGPVGTVFMCSAQSAIVSVPKCVVGVIRGGALWNVENAPSLHSEPGSCSMA